MSDQATHIVKHPRLYLSVNGTLQHVEEGYKITLTEAAAATLGEKVEAIKEKKALKVGFFKQADQVEKQNNK